jgi:hypothetical protein
MARFYALLCRLGIPSLLRLPALVIGYNPCVSDNLRSPEYPSREETVAATRAWLETDVIGLNLCPFAKAVHSAGQIRYFVSGAETEDALRADLVSELNFLRSVEAAEVDTTLLIHPKVFDDFLDYNDFLTVAEAAIQELGLVGIFQVASFHPRYQFAGTRTHDVENRTNRSPYPTLHLLREESVQRAVDGYPDALGIPRRNVETMRRLYSAGAGPPRARTDPASG